MNRETKMIQSGVDLLIATPGRLIDHLESASNNFLSKVSVFILDECDRLLDMGFSPRYFYFCNQIV
jgi:ATP-dependent RNA helicase RhlE